MNKPSHKILEYLGSSKNFYFSCSQITALDKIYVLPSIQGKQQVTGQLPADIKKIKI